MTFEEYRRIQKEQADYIRRRKRGVLVWNSASLSTSHIEHIKESPNLKPEGPDLSVRVKRQGTATKAEIRLAMAKLVTR